MQMKESKSPKALVPKVAGSGMTEGDKIRNSTSFNWGGFHSALGGLRLVPRNIDHRDWNWSLLSSLLSACLPWPHSLSTRRWGFSIWQETWSQQLDLFIFPTLTSEAKPRPAELRHTEMPAEGSICSCLTCSPWAVTMSRDVAHMHSYNHITRPSKQGKTQVLRRRTRQTEAMTSLCCVRYA